MAHMHYKGTGKVHSFRGLLTDVDGGNQNKIRIQGSVGAIAWRITKFQLMLETPYDTDAGENIVKIFREEQSSITATVNFEDDELLAAAIINNSTTGYQNPSIPIIVFDNALFVRNIWITNFDNQSTLSCNYYIELEEVKVSAAGMAQLAVAAARRTID